MGRSLMGWDCQGWLRHHQGRNSGIWPFPRMVDALYYSLRHPERGDYGAAILDAVSCVIGLLQLQPASVRRIIRLLSQAQDDGGTGHAEEIMRSLAQSRTTICSLMFRLKQRS